MNTIIFPEDVDNVIQSFMMVNNGDEATEALILAIGAELLDISTDEMYDRIRKMGGLRNEIQSSSNRNTAL